MSEKYLPNLSINGSFASNQSTNALGQNPVEQTDRGPIHSISCRAHGPGQFTRVVVERMGQPHRVKGPSNEWFRTYNIITPESRTSATFYSSKPI